MSFRMFVTFFFNDTSTPEIYTYGHTLSPHDALPISSVFVGFNGAPTGDVKNSFGKLLKACRFEHSTAKDYCQYSLRHLYATDLVGRGCQDGILAKLMGTSREKIGRAHV